MWDTIFRAGRQVDSHGRERVWTEAELDRLAASDPATIPLVAVHPQAQDKAATFGKVAELRRAGDSLQARYAEVPEVLQNLVGSGLKLAKSVSIDPVTMTLRHIGLLGAGQPPAVEGLGPVSFGREEDQAVLMYMESTQEDTVDPKDKKIAELEQQLQALQGKEAHGELQKQLDHAKAELKTEQEAHQATKAEFAAHKKEAQEKTLMSRVDALADSGRILPADKAKVLSFAKALDDGAASMEFAKGDGTSEKLSPRECYLRDLEAKEADKDGLLSEFARKGRQQQEDQVDLSKINNYA